MHHYCTMQNIFIKLKPPVFYLFISSPSTFVDCWWFYCLHSLTFFKTSYSWSHTVCSLFRLASFTSVQISSVAQSCPTLYDAMNHSMPGLLVHHQLPEFTQTHVHRVGDAIQPSHPLSSPSPPAPNPSQHQGLFQWVNSSHEVAKALEFQLQHQSFQWKPKTDLL